MVIALSLGKADVELFVGVMMIFTTLGKLFSTVLFLFFFFWGGLILALPNLRVIE